MSSANFLAKAMLHVSRQTSARVRVRLPAVRVVDSVNADMPALLDAPVHFPFRHLNLFKTHTHESWRTIAL